MAFERKEGSRAKVQRAGSRAVKACKPVMGSALTGIFWTLRLVQIIGLITGHEWFSGKEE